MSFRFSAYGSLIERICVGVAVAQLSLLAHVVLITLAILVLPLLASFLLLLRPTIVNVAEPVPPPVEMALVQLPEPEPEPELVIEPDLPPAAGAKTENAEPVKARAGAGAIVNKRRASDMARANTIATAKSAGILGVLASSEGGAFASLTGTADFSSGLDDRDVYGGLIGNEVGEASAFGYGGLGLAGTGRGGGGTGEGAIGLGSYGTIGRGSGTGSGYGRGSGRALRVRLGKVSVVRGDLDRNIVRRIVRRSYSGLRECAKDGSGSVRATLDVSKDGATTSAKASGVNAKTSACVRRVLKSLRYPRSESGARVSLRLALSGG